MQDMPYETRLWHYAHYYTYIAFKRTTAAMFMFEEPERAMMIYARTYSNNIFFTIEQECH